MSSYKEIAEELLNTYETMQEDILHLQELIRDGGEMAFLDTAYKGAVTAIAKGNQGGISYAYETKGSKNPNRVEDNYINYIDQADKLEDTYRQKRNELTNLRDFIEIETYKACNWKEAEAILYKYILGFKEDAHIAINCSKGKYKRLLDKGLKNLGEHLINKFSPDKERCLSK